MPDLQTFVHKLRPAPVASLIAHLSGFSRKKVVSTKRGDFLVNPVSYFGYSLTRLGDYEPSMVEVLHAVLTPGATFIDLGANEGYFSVIASRLVGPKGTVIAVEPQLRLQAILQTNFYLNECFNIRLIRAAVSGHANEVRLELSSDMNPGASSLYRRTKYPLRKETVKSFSLGKLLELTGLNRCDLMKVDVEGAEFEIFTEADDALRSGALRNLAVEFHEPIFRTRGICGQELDTRILSRGYVRNDIAGNRIYSLTS